MEKKRYNIFICNSDKEYKIEVLMYQHEKESLIKNCLEPRSSTWYINGTDGKTFILQTEFRANSMIIIEEIK